MLPKYQIAILVFLGLALLVFGVIWWAYAPEREKKRKERDKLRKAEEAKVKGKKETAAREQREMHFATYKIEVLLLISEDPIFFGKIDEAIRKTGKFELDQFTTVDLADVLNLWKEMAAITETTKGHYTITEIGAEIQKQARAAK